MNNLIKFPGTSPDPDTVLENLPPLTGVIVLGITPNGTEYFEASSMDNSVAVWLLERAKQKLLNS